MGNFKVKAAGEHSFVGEALASILPG